MTVDEKFVVVNGNAKFLCRDGPASERGERRGDCFFVKFGVKPRGGMYLGRCFLATDEAVGEVWAEYKSHPSLFCTVQDDDFVGRFRELSFAYDDLWVDDESASAEVRAKALRFKSTQSDP